MFLQACSSFSVLQAIHVCVCVAQRLSAVTLTRLRPTSHPSRPPRGHPGNRRLPRLAPVLSLSWSILQHFLPIHSGHTLTSLIITANTAAGAPRAPTTHTHTHTQTHSHIVIGFQTNILVNATPYNTNTFLYGHESTYSDINNVCLSSLTWCI